MATYSFTCMKASVARPARSPAQVLARALVRAADLLGLRQGDLAEVLGASAATVSRTFAGDREVAPESAEGPPALFLLRFFRSLDALVGGAGARARAWLSAPNRHLG